jgi:hypothetical protein
MKMMNNFFGYVNLWIASFSRLQLHTFDEKLGAFDTTRCEAF